MEADPDKPDNPVADFLMGRNIDLLSTEKKAKLAQLTALVSEISYNIDQTDFILKQLKETQRERKKAKIGPRTTAARLSKECLELLNELGRKLIILCLYNKYLEHSHYKE